LAKADSAADGRRGKGLRTGVGAGIQCDFVAALAKKAHGRTILGEGTGKSGAKVEGRKRSSLPASKQKLSQSKKEEGLRGYSGNNAL